MSKPKTKIYEIVELIRLHGPVSPNRLTELTGDFRQSVDRYVRQAHLAEMIHVSGFGPNPLGINRDVKLYSIGQGVDAQKAGKSVKATPRKKDIAPGSRRCKTYSEAEKRILREIKFSGKTVKSQIHRMPGRTLSGVERAIGKLKGKKKRGCTSWIWTAVIALLKEDGDLSTKEIAEYIGCTQRQVAALMSANHAEKNRSIYISSWQTRTGSPIAKWSFGDRPDAARPSPCSAEEELLRARVRRQIRNARSNPFAVAMNQLREAA
jgi:DNA-binding CsgD family transcriptional regulator